MSVISTLSSDQDVIENDRLVAPKPIPRTRLCPKGRVAPEIAHSARRLKMSLRRTQPKGVMDPGFVPISWDEALARSFDRRRSRRLTGSAIGGQLLAIPFGVPAQQGMLILRRQIADLCR